MKPRCWCHKRHYIFAVSKQLDMYIPTNSDNLLELLWFVHCLHVYMYMYSLDELCAQKRVLNIYQGAVAASSSAILWFVHLGKEFTRGAADNYMYMKILYVKLCEFLVSSTLLPKTMQIYAWKFCTTTCHAVNVSSNI